MMDDLRKIFEWAERTIREGETTQHRIDDLLRPYEDGNLVLVLGAGVSLPYGVPTWDDLLHELVVESVSNQFGSQDHPHELALLFSLVNKQSALISANFVKNESKQERKTGPNSFYEKIREKLYEQVKSKSGEETAITEICRLLAAPGRCPCIDSVITYNFDDILEQALEDMRVDLSVHCIVRDGIKPKRNHLPIYHVHGYLPRKSRPEEQDADMKVIFSERAYHEQYADAYTWNNLVQINKFIDKSCLFLGSSLQDPNTRRLLDIAFKRRGPEIAHYCIKEKVNPEMLKQKILQHAGQSDLEPLIKELDKLEYLTITLKDMIESQEQTDLEDFGVGVIWVDNYDEIPGLLRKLRESIFSPAQS